MAEKLIVSDTNIFLDLFDTELLKEFFNLQYEIKTSMLVIGEIKKDEQLQAIKPFIDSKKLKIGDISDEEFNSCYVLKLVTPGDLSIADCSVWRMAKNDNAKLLTSDAKLRKAAEKDNVEVHGILFVFDEMILNNIIPITKAIEKLDLLKEKNKRFSKKLAETKKLEWQELIKQKKALKQTKRLNDDYDRGI